MLEKQMPSKKKKKEKEPWSRVELSYELALVLSSTGHMLSLCSLLPGEGSLLSPQKKCKWFTSL